MKKSSRMPKIILFALGAGIIYISLTAFSPVKREMLSGRRINVLLLGVSETDYARHAEVIKIISFEPGTVFFDIVSLPRDTMIPVPYDVTWKQIEKADEIYARYRRTFKDDEKAVRAFSAKLERFLDNRLKIDYYIKVNYEAFVEIVDEIGGIQMEVLRPMKYRDSAQDLNIDIPAGIHVFDGETALKYVRYRDNITGDIGRLARQHRFLEQLVRKLKSPEIILRMPGMINATVKNLSTDFTWSDLLVFLDISRSAEFKNIRFQQIPGEPEMRWGKSYWNMDSEGMAEVLDVVKNSRFINMPAARIDQDASAVRPVTAEVWNASQKSGFARQMTDYLRKRNVDVVRFGNYGVEKRYTQVISRTGDLKSAREVAKLIGCRNINTEIDTSRMVDINVVIGKDFKPLWKE